MTDVKLKPCPFCGSSNVYVCGLQPCWVTCKCCGGEGPPSMVSDEHAANLWNDRKGAEK